MPPLPDQIQQRPGHPPFANPVNQVDPSGEFTIAQVSLTVGILSGLAASGLTALRGGTPREIVQNGVLVGVIAGSATFYGLTIAAASIQIFRALVLYPFLLGPLAARFVTPATLRTLQRIRLISRGDAQVFAQALRLGPAGANFQADLTALNQALQAVPSETTLQVFKLGTLQGSPVFGSLRTGVGIVDLNGVTTAVVMRGGQLIEILGPLR